MIKISKLLQAAALDEVPLLLVVAREEGRESFTVQADFCLPFIPVEPKLVLAHALQAYRFRNDGLHPPERICLQMLHHFANLFLTDRSSSITRMLTGDRTNIHHALPFSFCFFEDVTYSKLCNCLRIIIVVVVDVVIAMYKGCSKGSSTRRVPPLLVVVPLLLVCGRRKYRFD
jgi:hypothetical protein